MCQYESLRYVHNLSPVHQQLGGAWLMIAATHITSQNVGHHELSVSLIYLALTTEFLSQNLSQNLK